MRGASCEDGQVHSPLLGRPSRALFSYAEKIPMNITKTIRFEVFKRDAFRCQYCGQTPPAAILQVDHIHPRSKGGKNDINNLITACADCNLGKGARSLKEIPETVKKNLERIKERELQIEAYNEFLMEVDKRTRCDIEQIGHVFANWFPGYSFKEEFERGTLVKFLEYLPRQIVRKNLDVACARMKQQYGEKNGRENAIKYFCGICWKQIREKQNGQD